MGKLQDYRSVYEQEKGRLQEDKLNRDSFLSYFHDLAMDEVESLFEVREYLVDSCGGVDIYKELGPIQIRMRQYFKENFELLIKPDYPSSLANTLDVKTFKMAASYLSYFLRCYAKRKGNGLNFVYNHPLEYKMAFDATGKVNHDEQEIRVVNWVVYLMQTIFASSNWVLENNELVLRIPYIIDKDHTQTLEVHGQGNDGLQKMEFAIPVEKSEHYALIEYQEVFIALLVDLGLELDFIDFPDKKNGMITIKLPLSKLEDILNSDFMKATLTDEQKRVLTRW